MYSSKLSKSKFRNWLKAGLGVLFTKEGITPFVCEEIEQFQQKCLSDICNNNRHPAGTTCSGCCTENVVVCPTNRICNVGRGMCKFHRDSVTQYLPSGCPGKICHNFKNEIQKAHRYYGPSYRNTDATQWCSNSWEVAKCFMPPDGYKDVVSATETDFNGINSVIINFKDMQLKVHADLSKTSDIFNQGRDVGKVVRHSPDLEVEDTELQQYFTALQNILSDPGYLTANTAARNAKQKLSQLLNDTLVIGEDDVRKLLEDATKVAQDEIRTEQEEFKREADKQKLKLIEITNNSINQIEKRGQFTMSEVDKALRSAVVEIEKQRNESVRQLQAEADKTLKRIATEGDTVAENGIKKIRLESDAAVQKIASKTGIAVKQIEEGVETGAKKLERKAEEALQQIGEKLAKMLKKITKKLNDDLREDLVRFYTSEHRTILLDPLFEQEDTPVVIFTQCRR